MDVITYRGGTCRSPQGECGLKCIKNHQKEETYESRSPQGECGLKFVGFPIDAEQALSLPARGVWIEI